MSIYIIFYCLSFSVFFVFNLYETKTKIKNKINKKCRVTLIDGHEKKRKNEKKKRKKKPYTRTVTGNTSEFHIYFRISSLKLLKLRIYFQDTDKEK